MTMSDQSPRSCFAVGRNYDFGQPMSFPCFTLDQSQSSFGEPKKQGSRHFKRGRYIGDGDDGHTFEHEGTYFTAPFGTKAIQMEH